MAKIEIFLPNLTHRGNHSEKNKQLHRFESHSPPAQSLEFIDWKKSEVKKMPLVQVHKEARLIIGDNVTINSVNRNYHVNMFTRCKIMADRPDAEIIIGNNTRIHESCIHAFKKITIGNNCQIIDGNGPDLFFDNVDNRINTNGKFKEVIIEDSVWLGTGVIVLPGVKIGRGSVISANSVVTTDILPMTIAAGNPARFEG